MKKRFTTAMMMAAAISAAHAQVLTYNGEAVTLAKGEKVDSVNWNWEEGTTAFAGKLETGVKDEDRTVVYAEVPEVAANQAWMRVLKFDGLQIKPNTAYRVRVTSKASAGSQLQIAMMTGDEDCDMPWVAEKLDGKGKEEFRSNIAPSEDYYSTKSAMFYYGSDDLQQKYYGDYNKSLAMPANQFLRLSFMSEGEYYVDSLVVEEAPIAGIYFNDCVIKVDFGFATNAAALAAADPEGAVTLSPSLFTVTVNGDEVTPYAAEIKSDGLYLFLDDEDALDEEDEVLVSFKNEGTGLAYSGVLTPGDGKAVPSFEAEKGEYDDEVSASSTLEEPARLVSTTPIDGSFEMDGNTNTFTFKFNKDISAPLPDATLSGQGLKETLKPEQTDSRTITYKREAGKADLAKGTYTVTLDGPVVNELGTPSEGVISLTIEVGKVVVAEVKYTDLMSVSLSGENNGIPEGWTCMVKCDDNDRWSGGEVWEGGSACRLQTSYNSSDEPLMTFYLCDRDGKTYLMYGDQEENRLHLPAGNLDFGVNCYAHDTQDPRNVLFVLEDMAGNVVQKVEGTATVGYGNPGSSHVVVTGLSRISGKFQLEKEGDYILKIACTDGGYNAIQVSGFDVKTYTMTEGETVDNDVKLDASFANVPNDGVPAAGSGFCVYQNNELLEKGSVAGQRTRFMGLSNCEGLTKGFYNRDLGGATTSNYMTYGEDDKDLTDDIEEPILMLDVAKYNFSWMACNWKGDNNTYYFAILDEAGNQVYNREDVVTANVNGNAQAATAQKIEFSFTPAQAGRYILKWWMTGESVIGKIKVEKMGSLAVYWHNQLNDAVADAQTELDNSADDKYAGTARDALAKAIADAKVVTYHTGAEYQQAIDQLAQYVKDMVARRNALADYDKALSDLIAQVGSMEGTKYEGLASYESALALTEKYAEVEGYTLENEELLNVVAQLKSMKALNSNLMNVAVKAMTDQAVRLADLYVKLTTEPAVEEPEDDDFDEAEALEDDDFEDDDFEDETGEEVEETNQNEYVIAAGNALRDSQSLVAILKKLTTAALYQKIADGYNFETVDEEYELSEPETLDLTGYIRNSIFYAITDNRELANSEACNAAFPGWTFDAPNGLAADWGWGGWSGDNQPQAPVNVTNSQAGTKWGTDFKLRQDMTGVPVGIYSVGADVTDRSNVGDDNTLKDGYEMMSYLYITKPGITLESEDEAEWDAAGEESQIQKLPFDITNIGQYYGLTTTMFEDVEVAAVGETLTGELSLGAVCDVDASFAAVDNAKLHMSGKLPGFDYAAAAKKLQDEIEQDVKGVNADRKDAPATVAYYDLSGRQTAATRGIRIKVERWADGFMRVSKIMKK